MRKIFKKMLVPILVLAATICFYSTSQALTILPLYGDDSHPWGTYGGNINYGQLWWDAQAGSATFSIELDPSFTIFGFSFNTSIVGTDYSITIINGANWTYRGLNTSEGIGTDKFDFSLWHLIPGESNVLKFVVTKPNITSDSDFYRPNLFPANPVEWDNLLHQSHFGAYASNSDGVSYILSDSYYIPSNAIPTSAVPEPATIILLSSGLLGIFLYIKNFKENNLDT